MTFGKLLNLHISQIAVDKVRIIRITIAVLHAIIIQMTQKIRAWHSWLGKLAWLVNYGIPEHMHRTVPKALDVDFS